MKNNEIFTEEIRKKLDAALEQNEKIETPAALSKESIVEKLDPAKIKEEKKNIKTNYIVSIAACAAAFAILVSSTFIFPIGKTGNIVSDKNSIVSPVERSENVVVDDYSKIEKMFLDYAENKANNDFYKVEEKGDYIVDVGLQTENAGYNSSNGTSDSIAVNYTDTNIQTEGVDEGDVIKTDGEYIYSIVNKWENAYSCLNIVKVHSDGTLEKQSVIYPEGAATEKDSETLAQDSYRFTQMYLCGDVLVVVGENRIYSSCVNDVCKPVCKPMLRFTYNTVVYTYDISDKTTPVQTGRFSQDGSYVSSRVIDGRLVLLTNYYVDVYDVEEVIKETCVPKLGTNEIARCKVNDICIPNTLNSTSYLVVSNIDVSNVDSYDSACVLGGGDNVYSSTTTLFAVSNYFEPYNAENELTGAVSSTMLSSSKSQIFKFDITNGKVEYKTNAIIHGSMLNQFSMDEYEGYLRVATTLREWSEDDGMNLTNQVYVLDKELEIVGGVENIANGEEAKSVRFNGSIGYLVTFEQTDPLFVIDFSDVTHPVIKGELVMPGYSNYMHPVAQGFLLGVGYDGNENGELTDCIKLSLFDVSDKTNPTEVSKYVFPEDIYSTMLWNHKRFCFDKENSVLYVPYVSHLYDSFLNSEIECGVRALKIDLDSKSVTEIADYRVTTEDRDDWGVSALYINNCVFLINDNSIISYNTQDQSLVDRIDFDILK